MEKKYKLTDLISNGSNARKEVNPTVIVSEGQYAKGTILDANSILKLKLSSDIPNFSLDDYYTKNEALSTFVNMNTFSSTMTMVSNSMTNINQLLDKKANKSELDNYYTKTETGNTYVKKSGDTIGGSLTISTVADRKLIFDNTDDDVNFNLISFRQKGAEYGYLGAKETNSTILFWSGNDGIASRILTSTAPTGTAPLSVTSTTKVDNLNADMVDGHNATDFAFVGNMLDIDSTENRSGIYRLNSNTEGTLPNGEGANGASLINFFWDKRAGSQIFLPYSSNKAYVRNNPNGTYGSWKQLAFTDSIEELKSEIEALKVEIASLKEQLS